MARVLLVLIVARSYTCWHFSHVLFKIRLVEGRRDAYCLNFLFLFTIYFIGTRVYLDVAFILWLQVLHKLRWHAPIWVHVLHYNSCNLSLSRIILRLASSQFGHKHNIGSWQVVIFVLPNKFKYRIKDVHGESCAVSFFESSANFQFFKARCHRKLLVEIFVAFNRQVFHLLNLLVLGLLLEEVTFTGHSHFVTVWDGFCFDREHFCVGKLRFNYAHMAWKLVLRIGLCRRINRAVVRAVCHLWGAMMGD